MTKVVAVRPPRWTREHADRIQAHVRKQNRCLLLTSTCVARIAAGAGSWSFALTICKEGQQDGRNDLRGQSSGLISDKHSSTPDAFATRGKLLIPSVDWGVTCSARERPSRIHIFQTSPCKPCCACNNTVPAAHRTAEELHRALRLYVLVTYAGGQQAR